MKLVQRMLGLCLAGCLLLAGCARGGDVTDTPEPGSSRTTDGSTPQPAPSAPYYDGGYYYDDDDDDDDFIKGALIGAVLGVVVNNMITNNGN